MFPTLLLALALSLVPEDSPTVLPPFRWEKRPLLVFAPSSQDSNTREQLQSLRLAESELEKRDVVILLCLDPAQHPRLRQFFRIDPTQLTTILIGKDGGEKWRSTKKFPASEIFRQIDAMPMARAEARSREKKRSN